MADTVRTLVLNKKDNVAVALEMVHKGTTTPEGVVALDNIARGHKLAITAIAAGDPVLKFGQIIGFAKSAIAPGQWVHEHNITMGALSQDYDFGQGAVPPDILPADKQASFMGYRRQNGNAGTRNYIAVMTSVNCSATAASLIANQIERSGILADYPNIDGIMVLKQANGCVIDNRGALFDILKRTVWGYASNPNIGGVLLVGLGCEGFEIARFKKACGIEENQTFRTMTIQESGGTRKTVEAGVAAIKQMLPPVNDVKRVPVSVSELVLALQCGGSDGYSGITANPALGMATDILVKNGGTAILSETPEIYGA
ncbi:Altronate dehydratase, partial [hydrothermal vent metagenome]